MSTEDKSSKIKEALRRGFLNGTSKLAGRKCYGYDRTADGSLVINQEEAAIVKRVFESYCDGASFGKIAEELEKRGILSPTGKWKWNREAISNLLSNEKYVGSVLLQKTICRNSYQVKNQGELDKVIIHNHHTAIISDEMYKTVQNIKLKRYKVVTEEPKFTIVF
jgi:hypothetical protein